MSGATTLLVVCHQKTASFGLQQVTCQHILGIELKFIALLLINNKSVCGSRAELIMLQNIPIILLGTSPPPPKNTYLFSNYSHNVKSYVRQKKKKACSMHKVHSKGNFKCSQHLFVRISAISSRRGITTGYCDHERFTGQCLHIDGCT